MNLELYQKEGTAQLPDFSVNENLNNPVLYTPSDALKSAVNVALALGQPLLVTGEPGTGKTQLAYHVAHFFGLGGPLIFNAQTTSVANNLFYNYDALGHFQYNQNHREALSTEELEKKFIHYNALGEAIRRNKRMVVLIDEIDKAPRDLPNDLLFAIESLSFRVSEINKSFQASTTKRPIIIITSNSEKNLPDAFMRRVVYHHIKFP
ncbi:MAG: MoxR family ATPase, partial [Bacteroidota bacterium]